MKVRENTKKEFFSNMALAINSFLLALALLAGGVHAQTFEQQDVAIFVGDSMRLSGTLTLPVGVEGDVPAVILVTGSGAQNRDEELMGHRPFKVIAEYLSSHGYAVLRCDDRGVGGSTGDMVHATTLDFANDVQQQVRYLQGSKELGIDPDRIYIFGHSEGACVAAIVAAENSRAQHPVAGVAMLGGAAVDGKECLLQQNEAIFRQKGVADSLVERRLGCMRELFAVLDTLTLKDGTDTVKVINMAFRPIFKKYGYGLTKEQKQQVGLTTVECYGWAVSVATEWMRTFLRLNPAEYIARLRCPLLAIGGSKDCQVVPTNLQQIEKICEEHNVACTVCLIKDANHLGQICVTGGVEEYSKLGQAPDEEVLKALIQWLTALNEK